MITYYRLCGIPSTNPSPVLQEDKFALNKLCLRSFVEAFKEVQPDMVILADFCGPEYEAMIKEVVPFKYSYIPTNIGINETCLMQYEMASTTTDEVILFQECDYLYRPGTGKLVEQAIQHFNLFSPYDHKNFYIDGRIHSRVTELEVFENHHFRTTERNTMTFGMTRRAFTECLPNLKRWGYLDNMVWHEMRAKGFPLWVPIPAFATHMTKDWLAPGVEWETLWKTLI